MEHALHRQQERIEDGTDAQRGQHHRHEVLARRFDGGIFRGIALAEIFQIAVDDHDGVVDNHAQHHDECRQCHYVQLNARHIHDSHRYKGAEWDGDTGHNGRAQGEEHHHDENDDDHRDNEVAQEVADAQCHHLWLVGNAGDGDVVGQLLSRKATEHTFYFLAVLHHVVARRHFHRQQHAGVSVLFYATALRVVLAHHTGYIANTGHLA